MANNAEDMIIDGMHASDKISNGMQLELDKSLAEDYINAKDGGYSFGKGRYTQSQAYRDKIRGLEEKQIESGRSTKDASGIMRGSKEHKKITFELYQAELDGKIADDRYKEAGAAEARDEYARDGKEITGGWMKSLSPEARKKRDNSYKAIKDNFESRYNKYFTDYERASE